MYGNLRRLNTAEHGLVRASLFAQGHGRKPCCDANEFLNRALGGEFAAEPNGKARNLTAGVQDWSVGPLYPCTVQVRGDHECTQYQAADLHDADYTFEPRDTYAGAEADARRHLAHLEKHGRAKATQIRNLHNSKGGVHSFADVAA